MTTQPTWRRPGASPPPAANGHASLCFDPQRGALLLAAFRDEALEIWAWANSTRWSLVRSEERPDQCGSRPILASDGGRVVLFCYGDGDAWIAPPEGGAPVQAPCPGLRGWSSPHGFAGYDPAGERFLVHRNKESGDGGVTFSWDGTSWARVAKGPYLLSGCWRDEPDELVGVDVFGRLFAFDGAAWRARPGAAKDGIGSDIAWDPARGAIVRLFEEGGGMALWSLRDRWRREAPRLDRPMLGAALGVDPGRGLLVSYGGADQRHTGDWSAETWLSEGGDFRSTRPTGRPRIGRYITPGRFGGRAVLFDHSALSVLAYDGGGWSALVPSPARAPERLDDDRFVNFAAGDERLYALDREGGVWWSAPGGAWAELAAPGGPGGFYSRRVGLAWHGGRLVLFVKNRTWVLEQGAWRQLDPPKRPPSGGRSMVSTPEGLYLATRRDVWRMVGDGWERVVCSREWFGRSMVYDPQRRLLLSVCTREVGARLRDWLGVVVDHAWTPLIELPAGVSAFSEGSGGASVALDPASAQLLLVDAAGVSSLDLSALGLPRDQLPTVAQRRRR